MVLCLIRKLPFRLVRKQSADIQSWPEHDTNSLVRKRLLPSSCMLVHMALRSASLEEGDASYSCNLKRSIRRRPHTSVLLVEAAPPPREQFPGAEVVTMEMIQS